MKFKRNYVTPYITWIFIVTGLSGILMFFHVLDGYTEAVHEILGLLFIIFGIIHIIINWKSLKGHFKSKKFISSFCIILLLSGVLIYIGRGHGDHERLIMEKLIKAPINKTFEILEINSPEAMEILKKNKILIENSKTIKEIGINNQKAPEEIIELLIK